MSDASADLSWLSAFDILAEHEHYLLLDSETGVSLSDQELFSVMASGDGSDTISLPNTGPPQEASALGLSPTPQTEKVEERDKRSAQAAPLVERKRKSWGQELPIPTTNLPPRKRAKTEAEKEQRRVERVLRNRAAAQSSRERKRKEVETLEKERASLAESNTEIRARLAAQEEFHRALSQQLEDMQQTIRRYEELLKVPNGTTATSAVGPMESLNQTSELPPLGSIAEKDLDIFAFLDGSEAAPAPFVDPAGLLLAYT